MKVIYEIEDKDGDTIEVFGSEEGVTITIQGEVTVVLDAGQVSDLISALYDAQEVVGQ